jgi:hypothetical protein
MTKGETRTSPHHIELARLQIREGDESLRVMPHRLDFAIGEYTCAIHNAMVAGGFSNDEADAALSKYTELLRVQVNSVFPRPRGQAPAEATKVEDQKNNITKRREYPDGIRGKEIDGIPSGTL